MTEQLDNDLNDFDSAAIDSGPIVVEEDRIWERLPIETPRAYAAFLHYRNTPASKRSLRDTCTELYGNSANYALVSKWSSKYDWVRRSFEYDRYLDDLESKRWIDRRVEARERDWAQANKMREIVDEVIDAARRDFILTSEKFIPGGDGNPDKIIVKQRLDVTALLKMVELSSKFQRLASELPTQSIEYSSRQLDHMIAKEIAKMAQLVHGEDGVKDTVIDDGVEGGDNEDYG